MVKQEGIALQLKLLCATGHAYHIKNPVPSTIFLLVPICCDMKTPVVILEGLRTGGCPKRCLEEECLRMETKRASLQDKEAEVVCKSSKD